MSGEICIYVWDFFFKENGQDLYLCPEQNVIEFIEF